jgi:ankyrin repeat protein
VNVTTPNGWMVLMRTAANEQLDVARFLMEHGSDVNSAEHNGTTVLMWVASIGHVDLYRFLTECGVKVNAKAKFQHTALTRTAANGRIDGIRFLAEHGADINAKEKNKNEWTALIAAAVDCQTEIVHYLIKRSPDVFTNIKYGNTAFACAAASGHMDVARFLTERGDEVATKDKDKAYSER